ncbi:MAG: hypothetical protein AB7U63_13170 [Porticoccaceae bacterium]|jgi:uncharacterized membrane protein YjdF
MDNLPSRIHRILVATLLVIMCAELAATLYNGLWIHSFLIIGIITVTLIPFILGRQYQIHIPAEFQILAVIFVFASLFLGEIHSYYEKIWWWDIALHGSSGLLLGILGFLLVYLLNENDHVEIDLTPRFVAFFAFLFAVAIGALWEIFEFAMDKLFATNMQKPMLGDASGLTDTMFDLIVDTLGALIISTLGWWYMVKGESIFIDRWIRKFIARNPRFFRRHFFRKRYFERNQQQR